MHFLRELSVCLLILLSTIGCGDVQAGEEPPTASAQLERFERAWEAGDVAVLAGFFDPDVVNDKTRWLTGIATGHGWKAGWPELSAGRVTREGTELRMSFELDTALVELAWSRRGASWVLERLVVPLPSIDPLLARFVAAWGAPDLIPLGELCPRASRDTMTRSLERRLAREGWTTRPALEEVDRSSESARRWDIRYACGERGELVARWVFSEEGGWVLGGLDIGVL